RANEVGDQLGMFLCRMHEGGMVKTELAPKSLIRETYLGKMLEYIDRIFNFVQRKETFSGNEITEEVQALLFENIGKIIQYQQKLTSFPAAYMHGDLHLRNIMVRGLEGNKEQGNLGLTFKLIDLEFLRADGDAAFDLGQLIVDIDLVAHEEDRQVHFDAMMTLCSHINRCYSTLTPVRKDDTFDTRIELAKARALLRIAKGKTKRGYRFMETDQRQQAHTMAEQVMMHASAALGHLEAVTKAIC
ncbi:MAG: aminoglycoside phosphotransferase family protein, partial [Anaerolineae bacterium]|nr:aminoglycoside phosphotransferase family protein [Anaerolineae bacterium]